MLAYAYAYAYEPSLCRAKRGKKNKHILFQFRLNRPFAGSGHMVRNKLHWDANDAVGLPKQRKVGLDW